MGAVAALAVTISVAAAIAITTAEAEIAAVIAAVIAAATAAAAVVPAAAVAVVVVVAGAAARRAHALSERQLTRAPFPHAKAGFLVEWVPSLLQRQCDLSAMMRFVRDQIAKPGNRVRFEALDLAGR